MSTQLVLRYRSRARAEEGLQVGAGIVGPGIDRAVPSTTLYSRGERSPIGGEKKTAWRRLYISRKLAGGRQSSGTVIARCLFGLGAPHAFGTLASSSWPRATRRT